MLHSFLHKVAAASSDQMILVTSTENLLSKPDIKYQSCACSIIIEEKQKSTLIVLSMPIFNLIATNLSARVIFPLL